MDQEDTKKAAEELKESIQKNRGIKMPLLFLENIT